MTATFLLLLIGAIVGTYFLTYHTVEARYHNSQHNGSHNDGLHNQKLARASILNPSASELEPKKKLDINYRLPTHLKPTHYT